MIYEHWFDFAEFCLQDDIRTYAHEYVHENAANINNAVLGKQKTAYGYRWVKAMDYESQKEK